MNVIMLPTVDLVNFYCVFSLRRTIVPHTLRRVEEQGR